MHIRYRAHGIAVVGARRCGGPFSTSGLRIFVFFYSTPLRNKEKLLRLTELGMTVGTQQIGVKRNVNMGMAHHRKSVYMRVMNVCSVFGVRKSECVSCVMCIAYTTHNIGFERII